MRADAYEEANTLIKQHVPMVPIAHAGSATAWQAGLEGAHSSPLANEELAVIDGGEDGTLVFMQSGEPGGLYCADESDGESLRVCEQIMQSLYTYETGGGDPGAGARLGMRTQRGRLGVDLHPPGGRHVP